MTDNNSTIKENLQRFGKDIIAYFNVAEDLIPKTRRSSAYGRG